MSISSVTSEALQLKLRQLLPSQQGFGTDLSASDTIIPVIDLTAAAEGSDVGQNLQTAFSFASINPFNAINGSDVVANTAGFWKIYWVVNLSDTGTTITAEFELSDGASTKELFLIRRNANGAASYVGEFVVFLNSGESITAISNNVSSALTGSAQQIADVNGVLIQPAGFNPQ